MEYETDEELRARIGSFFDRPEIQKHLAEANEVMNKVPFLTAEEIAEMKAEGRLK